MIVALLGLVLAPKTQDAPLWSLGAPDGRATDFGLAPGGYARYESDPLYLVGTSTERQWPYVLPGPDDGWAGSRSHRAEIVFGASGVARGAKGTVRIDFADAHRSAAPDLELVLNGRSLAKWRPTPGRSDDVIEGKAPTGQASQWTVELPAGALRDGNNTLAIVNGRGSWAVFDAISFTSPDVRLAAVRPALAITSLPGRQAILKTPAGDRQPLAAEVTNIGPARSATLSIGGETREIELTSGRQTVEWETVPAQAPRTVKLRLVSGADRAEASLRIERVRPWTIYLFPHSHVDIGYTGRQADVLAMHERNLEDAIAVARENAANPEDSRYRFHVEATWVIDRYLQRATPEQRDALTRAIRERTIGVSAGYANLLTGVMNPEELMQSLRYSRLLGDRLGVAFDTVSQTDVPGVSWGTVAALHEAGIKNLVLMPNAGDRVGRVHVARQDRPFWWVGPSGRERVLVWQTDPYSVGVGAGWDGDRSRIYRTADPSGRFIGRFLFPKLDRLVREGYPYDLVAEPWSVIDNAPIDADVPVAAKAWNERYATPRVVISTLSDACAELTRRYGAKLPIERGDYTPYWEDGVGSSSAETAMNRATPDRLIQAETLFAMRGGEYPAQGFLEAWRNVLLFSEHTWGADVSVWQPDSPTTKDQWAVKQGFALTADAMSRTLLGASTEGSDVAPSLEVRNTTSWPRTDLVRLSPEKSSVGDRVEDAAGTPMPSQRLRSGELAVLVRDVPPFGAKTLVVRPGVAHVESIANAEGATLRSDEYAIALDPATGGIASLRSLALGRELAAPSPARPLNGFLYLPGADVKDVAPNERPSIEVVEPGPLVATLRATSRAPGANGLVQETTLVAGLDGVLLENTIDKLPVRTKEGVHFAFPFAVPEGQVRVDLPWALVRPERDQIAGANKNWLTTNRYVDVSNGGYGVTWSSLDAPLIEVGALSANLIGSVGNPDEWRATIAPTGAFYSWALNNHWHTNYRADQSGRLVFRYAMQAHRAFRPENAWRWATALRQPLVVASGAANPESLLKIDDPSVVATRMTPTDDGRAILVRLWGASGRTKRVRLAPRSDLGTVTRTDLSQRPGRPVGDAVEVPGWGIVTLRVERKSQGPR